MSTTTQKKHSDLKKIGVVIFIIFLIVVALFAVGCSTPVSATPDPEASSASTPVEEEPAPPAPLFHAFGDTVTYDDGFSISVSQPSPHTPSEYAAGMIEGQPVVAFEIVVTNNTAEAVDPSLVLVTASSAGTEASGVFDTGSEIGFPPMTSVLPGQTIKWNQAWSVADPESITLEVLAGFTYDSSIFTNTQ